MFKSLVSRVLGAGSKPSEIGDKPKWALGSMGSLCLAASPVQSDCLAVSVGSSAALQLIGMPHVWYLADSLNVSDFAATMLAMHDTEKWVSEAVWCYVRGGVNPLS